MQRDELGTSMIENTDDDELAENINKCKAGYKNLVLRQEEELFGSTEQATESQEEN